ncbi:hypothetical protein GCM10023219_15870 [Stakelama sediminis]|uniref:DNA-binding CsgD family transcriptional regulator n=1 Tax=Stakelama sediminis TaxID=463200 RepID=A0A840YXN7_9SPHN|nr:helix-turn-helix transcriptional regulator [Stakelama sediminis]MBB5718317.1 DNA-binding CsgD family transcriptional regulator [Stakelama sediminis]
MALQAQLAQSRGDENASHITAAALNWLACEENARMLVSGALKIVWANPCALDLLDGRTGVEDREGFLFFEQASVQRALLTFARGTDNPTATMVAQLDGGNLVLHARRLTVGDGQVVGLTMMHDNGGFVPRYVALDIVFGLTPAEHDVLQSIVVGKTVATIADEGGIAPGTVRSHIRQIYAKLDVSSREQLLFRLSPYRLP